MKPQDLYSGNAPTAMAQMGQGLAQAGANIANIQNQGSSAMTSGLMGGVNTALNQYQQYESAKTSNDITRSMIKDPEYGKLLGLDPNAEDYEDRKKGLLSKLDQQIKAHGQIGGAQFSKQFLGPIQEYATIGRQYKQELDKIAAESSGRLTLGAMNVAPEWAKIGLEQQKLNQVTSDKQRADATRQKALLNFAESLKPSAPQQAAPAPAPAQPSFGSGIDLAHPTSFQNLSPEDKKRVQSTALGPDQWNSFDAAARQEMLANPKHRIWR